MWTLTISIRTWIILIFGSVCVSYLLIILNLYARQTWSTNWFTVFVLIFAERFRYSVVNSVNTHTIECQNTTVSLTLFSVWARMTTTTATTTITNRFLWIFFLHTHTCFLLNHGHCERVDKPNQIYEFLLADEFKLR